MLYESFSKATLAGELLFIEPSMVGVQLSNRTLSPALVDTPQFVLSLITGVLLAIVLHVLITTFTVVTGTSLINTSDTKAESALKSEERRHPARIGAKLGIWTICTVWVSLFMASLLAIKLSLGATHVFGLTLGLVIWTVFFTIMDLAMKPAFSIIDRLSDAIIHSLSSLVKTMKGEELNKAKAKPTPASSPGSVQGLYNQKISRQILQYLDSLVVCEPDYNLIKCELAKLLNDTLGSLPSDQQEILFDQKSFIQLVEGLPHLSKRQVRKLVALFDEVKQEVSSLPCSYAATEGAERCGQATEDTKQQLKKARECYQLNTGKELLNPNSIRQDIESIIKGPLGSKELGDQAAPDRMSLFALLAQRAAILEEDTEQASTYLEKTFDSIRQRFMVPTETARETIANGCNSSSETQAVFDQNVTVGNVSADCSQDELSVIDQFKRRLYHLVTSISPAELNYNCLQLEFEQLFNDFYVSSYGLEEFLRQYNAASLEGLVAHRDHISSSTRIQIVAAIKSAVEAVSRRATNTQNDANYRAAQLEALTTREVKQVKRVTAPMKGVGLLSLAFKWTKHTRIG